MLFMQVSKLVSGHYKYTYLYNSIFYTIKISWISQKVIAVFKGPRVKRSTTDVSKISKVKKFLTAKFESRGKNHHLDSNDVAIGS